MKDRNMYYGYEGYMPFNNSQLPPFQQPNYNISNDMNERINRLERQIKRLEQRITRLETPYINTQTNEPDNNMYMM